MTVLAKVSSNPIDSSNELVESRHFKQSVVSCEMAASRQRLSTKAEESPL
jgi:hypothetical protein